MNNEQETIDWERLKKALLVEAERGFQNIQGQQYIFNDFLSISLSKQPITLKAYQNQFQELSKKFASYPGMTREERQNLLEITQHFLNKMQSFYAKEKQQNISELHPVEITAKIQKNNSNFSQQYTNNLELQQQLKDDQKKLQEVAETLEKEFEQYYKKKKK